MMKYQINYTINGTTSEIDTVYTVDENYTADQYIKDCEANADQEWIDMIQDGEITVVRF